MRKKAFWLFVVLGMAFIMSVRYWLIQAVDHGPESPFSWQMTSFLAHTAQALFGERPTVLAAIRLGNRLIEYYLVTGTVLYLVAYSDYVRQHVSLWQELLAAPWYKQAASVALAALGLYALGGILQFVGCI